MAPDDEADFLRNPWSPGHGPVEAEAKAYLEQNDENEKT